MTIGDPVAVFSDAFHPTDVFRPGPVATVVAALREQQGRVDVTARSDIAVDGYLGKTFRRTAPAEMSDGTTRDGGSRSSGGAVFPSWRSADGIPVGDGPGDIETRWVFDLDGTVVVISTTRWPGPSSTDHTDLADAVLDSIRIHRP